MRTSSDEVRHSIEGELRFERFLADLSARFVNLRSEGVGTAIDEARASLWGVPGMTRGEARPWT
jgi:hypothetical protein